MTLSQNHQYVEKEIYEYMREDLEKTVASNYVDLSLLKFDKRKNYWSITFDGKIVVRLSCAESIDFFFSDNEKLSIYDISEIDRYIPKLQGLLQEQIDKIPKEFDCCHLYMECSNEKHCIHSDLSFSKGCGYRRILNSGRIFYGEGRNI